MRAAEDFAPASGLLAAGLEAELGLERYLTDLPGTGGRLKREPEDFIVEEVPLAFPAARGPGKYTIAAIRSRNWETNRLMAEIASRLQVGREALFFAGTKDKRAVTTQYVAIRAPQEAVARLAIRDVEVLETFRADRAPKIGELIGNRFRVLVRELPVPLAEADARARAILARLGDAGGFPNYFGVQRFGVLRPVTHVVGERMLRGDLEGAVLAYVGNPVPGEAPETREPRARFEKDRDASAALAAYPEHLSFERGILRSLQARPGDFAQALRSLPLNLLTMFVYAYQSLLFNRLLSERLRRGLPIHEPVEGDLIVGLGPEGTPDRDRFVPVGARNLEKVRAQCRKGRAFVTGEIFGHASPRASGEPGEIEARIVAEAAIFPEAFLVPHFPEAASAGTRRELLAPLSPVPCEAKEDAQGGHLAFEFFLAKGSYATCFLREILKSRAAAFA